MSTATQTKPSYLGLLNAIALAEGRAGVYLRAWAAVTPDPDLRACLTTVAARETSHGEVFKRRIEELGFSVLDREDPKFEQTLAKLGSPDISDLEKVRREEQETETDFFGPIEQQIEDGIFDPLTAVLLRWYIAEERDSTARAKAAYAAVRARG